ncbi:alpha-galactosidase A [Sarocladium implicatum]|nr:alpha-galactosidase A [Sarocladium implicatum]
MLGATPDIEVLSQYIDNEDANYRLRVGEEVRYLQIPVDGVFDDDILCRPYLLIPQLPDLPDSPWTVMSITRNNRGQTTFTVSTEPLPEIQTIWHDRRVDVLSLKRTRRFRSGVHEVQYNGAPAIAKIACFEWEIPRLERETWAYSVLAQHQQSHPTEPPISPNFLAHVTEGGKVIGILLEKVDGIAACIDHLAACETLLERLHCLNLVHGDVNRYHLLVQEGLGCGVRLIDFEHAAIFDEEMAREELRSLPTELAEDTARGASVALGE